MTLDSSTDTHYREVGNADLIEPSSLAAAIEFAELVGNLKTTPRTGWVRRGVPQYESVADHSWRVAALALLLDSGNDVVGKNALNATKDDHDQCTRRESLDIAKCMQMAVVHDLAECLVGDIAPGDNISIEDKHARETTAMLNISSLLRRATAIGNGLVSEKATKSEILLNNLFQEYEERHSKESLVVKDLDLLDMILQANTYEVRFGINLTEFFDGTPATRFQTPKLAKIAQLVHQQRSTRIENSKQTTACEETDAVTEGNEAEENTNVKGMQYMSKSDCAFVTEYSKASLYEADTVRDIIQALRHWEQHEPR